MVGPEDRECQVLFIDSLLLTYWVDDATREVRIVTLEWPD